MQRIILFLILSFLTINQLRAQDTLKTLPVTDTSTLSGSQPDTTESLDPPNAPPPIELSEVGADSATAKPDSAGVQIVADSLKTDTDYSCSSGHSW